MSHHARTTSVFPQSTPTQSLTSAEHEHGRHFPMAPPELNEDIAAEILLRIPPDERADLIRASAVSKLWLHVVSDPDFVRRYNSFHRREGDEVFFVSADVTSYKYTVEVNKCTFEVKPVRVTQVGEPRNYRCATLP